MNSQSYIILDFDQTIAKHHLHHACIEILYNVQAATTTGKKKDDEGDLIPKSLALKTPLEDQVTPWTEEETQYIWKKLQNNFLIPTGKIEDWKFIFHKLTESEQQVIIASYCGFRFVIEKFLEQTLKLSPTILAKIKIESWLPSDQTNKNLHLDHIVSNQAGQVFKNVNEFRLTETLRIKKYAHLWLIDDSKKNTDAVIEILKKSKDEMVRKEATDHVLNVLSANDNTPQVIMLWLQQKCEINFGFNSY